MKPLRADLLLVEKGFFTSRAKAQEAIEAGLVSADGALVRKASQTLSGNAVILAEAAHPYVSRGALKLVAALDAFGFDPRGLTGLDIGASTGGFTQVLLERGARHVYAVDVGEGQLHGMVRRDARVTSLEKQDARALNEALIPVPAQVVVVDVSFISLRLVLPELLALMAQKAWLVVLLKPQFEVGRKGVKKGIVRDPTLLAQCRHEMSTFIAQLGFTLAGLIESPILGGDGNREYLIGAFRE